MTEPEELYLADHVRESLLNHPAVGEQDLHVHLRDGAATITGTVATPERRDAVGAVARDLLPGWEIRNHVVVVAVSPLIEEEEV